MCIIRFLLNSIVLILFFFWFPTFQNCNFKKVKFVLLSDMHITGEFSSPLIIRIWSDFHLRRMIGEIKSHVNNVIFIHAGDLFHEGFFSYTSDDKWSTYVQRLEDIFKKDAVFSAVGNHDIGFPDRVNEKNMLRFSKVGYLDHVTTIKNETFQFVNSIIINSTVTIQPESICIIHYPLVNLPDILAKKLSVCKKIFTGHDHTYKLYGHGKETNLPSFNPLQGTPFGFVLLHEDGTESVCFGISEKIFFSFLTFTIILVMLTNIQKWDFLTGLILGISLFFFGNVLAVMSILGYVFSLLLPLFSNFKYIPQILIICLIVFLSMLMGQMWDWESEIYCYGSCIEYKVI